MKINGIPDALHQQKSVRNSGPEAGKSFAQILDQTKGQADPSCTQASAVSGGDPLACTATQPLFIGTEQVLGQASSLLGLMDDFAKALGNPNKTLKSMEPLVRQMEKELKDLEASSVGQDQSLSKLTNEIAVTAQIETMKFNRGDYV